MQCTPAKKLLTAPSVSITAAGQEPVTLAERRAGLIIYPHPGSNMYYRIINKLGKVGEEQAYGTEGEAAHSVHSPSCLESSSNFLLMGIPGGGSSDGSRTLGDQNGVPAPGQT